MHSVDPFSWEDNANSASSSYTTLAKGHKDIKESGTSPRHKARGFLDLTDSTFLTWS